MRTVVCKQLGPLSDLVVEDHDPPIPGEGQVVVDVRAAGVNFVDGLLCQGRYQIKPPTPFHPGGEIAGEVSAIGAGVTGVAVGDRVIVSTGFGGFAEQVAVPALSVMAMPDGLGFGQAATVIQSYATVLFTLTRRTSVQPGEWVLVLGAGGGVGLAAIDLARALGARVIAAASTQEKLDKATAMGAEATIAYEEEDLKVRAREISDGGVDVVIDSVGGRHSEPALRAIRPFGRFCVIGFASGPIASVPLNQVLLNNRTVVGVDWGAWTFRDPLGNRELLAELVTMIGDGRLHPTVPSEYPLEEAGAVMSGLIDRTLSGKVVLVP
ncbi:MAG TPA: NADPH:quinone oxidoreductase family protein [Acidimicrobiales bacterium]|jgi:NADPH2:quinone reductase|nr:NADPH:quinone oxidoreductase family protein [Acidimicrobiales bacterium]